MIIHRLLMQVFEWGIHNVFAHEESPENVEVKPAAASRKERKQQARDTVRRTVHVSLKKILKA